MGQAQETIVSEFGGCDMEGQAVFVYGSLRKGYYNHWFLDGASFVAEDRVAVFQLHRLCSSYPTAVRTDEAGDVIVVETYLVDDKTLAALDRLEGHPNSKLFGREEVVSQSGRRGFMYCCSDAEEIKHIRARERLIPSGDWSEVAQPNDSD